HHHRSFTSLRLIHHAPQHEAAERGVGRDDLLDDAQFVVVEPDATAMVALVYEYHVVDDQLTHRLAVQRTIARRLRLRVELGRAGHADAELAVVGRQLFDRQRCEAVVRVAPDAIFTLAHRP